MKKRKREEIVVIYDEAMEILERAAILRETAEWHAKEIEKFVTENSDEEMDLMEWGEKEGVYKKADELAGRLNVSIRELNRLNDDYDRIREKVNTYYNREVMPGMDMRIVEWEGEGGI